MLTLAVPTTTRPAGGLLGSLYTLAETPRFEPQTVPVVVYRPGVVELIVNASGVSVAQTTVLVMSRVSKGWT